MEHLTSLVVEVFDAEQLTCNAQHCDDDKADIDGDFNWSTQLSDIFLHNLHSIYMQQLHNEKLLNLTGIY